MKILIKECKKIMDIRVLLVIAVFTVLFYHLFLEVTIYPAGGQTTDSPYDMPFYAELIESWGTSLPREDWSKLDEKRKELGKRFSGTFLHQVEGFRETIFAEREIRVAKARGVSVMRQVGEGGIFAALYRLAKEADTGLVVDLKAMPVRQETIEICEYYKLNPYQLASTGNILMICDDGEALADALRKEETEAAVIGRLTDNNDKIIQNGEDIRYIDRPAPDELMKI